MNALETLIAALREELQEYGELLALMDQQQASVMNRAADNLLETVCTIDSQAKVIQAARRHREKCQSQLADELGLSGEPTFARLLPRLPEEYRLLIGALVEENNHLLQRVQKRGHQNNLLLSRSLELMQRFLTTLAPSSRTAVYNEHGDVSMGVLPGRRLWDAVG